MSKVAKDVCPTCKGELQENAKFCPHCGKEIYMCSNCGAPLANGAQFCIKCGANQARDQNQQFAQKEIQEQKPAFASEQVTYSSLRGCIHNERPKTKRCTNCGAALCYECSIEELMSSRMTAYSKVDAAYSQEYGFFCPSCYIERISDNKYKLPRSGVVGAQKTGVAPNLLNPLTYLDKTLIAINIVLVAVAIYAGTYQGLGGFLILLGIPLVIDIIFYVLSRNAYRDFVIKKQRALNLLKEHKSKL